MAAPTKAVKSAAELLADKADTAATWVTGPRAASLHQLADDIRALGTGDTSRLDAEVKAQEEAAAAALAEQEAAAQAAKEAAEAAEAARKADQNS